jgi:hypothetical protein
MSGDIGGVAVYRCEGSGPWTELAEREADGLGAVSFVDREIRAGGRYGYRLRLGSAPGIFGGEVWVSVPLGPRLALEGARPNPSVGPLSVAFSLPDERAAELTLFDVTGRVVSTRQVGALGPGQHVVSFKDGAVVAAGVYWVKLSRGGEALLRKAVVVH